MIFATTKPITEYGGTAGGKWETLGLYASYGDYPELLALVMVATPLGFKYEGSLPESERPGEIKDIKPFTATLETEIEGKLIGEHLKKWNPIEFHTLMSSQSQTVLEAIPLVEHYCAGNTELFLGMIAARSAAWALNYRGPLLRKGNLHTVSFTGVPVSEESKQWYKHLEAQFAHAN